jgi:hypothetical protein
MWPQYLRLSKGKSEKIVDAQKQEIREKLAKHNQANILKTLEVSSEEDAEGIYRDMLNFDFDSFDTYMGAYWKNEHIISDVNKITNIPEKFIINKNSLSEEEIGQYSEDGLRLIAEGSGQVNSGSHFAGCRRRPKARIRPAKRTIRARNAETAFILPIVHRES